MRLFSFKKKIILDLKENTKNKKKVASFKLKKQKIIRKKTRKNARKI